MNIEPSGLAVVGSIEFTTLQALKLLSPLGGVGVVVFVVVEVAAAPAVAVVGLVATCAVALVLVFVVGVVVGVGPFAALTVDALAAPPVPAGTV
ncbi:MAG TPA: hypothetical protein VEJ84_14300, partial [Acidimicrobiales bacterium]|nr:hypothetical protein [Acidimicrobiales bacterium]